MRLYEKLITEDRVELVMGPYSSAITEAVANVTEKYKKLMLAPLGSAGSIWEKGRRYVIMLVSPAEVYLEGLIDLAARNGLKSIALIYEDTLFPKTSVRGAIALARKRGLEVVLQEAYPKAQTDFAALLTKIKAVAPDVLAAATYFDDVVAITRQMRELDVNVRMFGTTVGGDLPEFYKAVGRTAEFVYGASQWEPGLAYPGAREFAAVYESEFGRAALLSRRRRLRRVHAHGRGHQPDGQPRFRAPPRVPLQAQHHHRVRRLRRGRARLSARPPHGDDPVAGGAPDHRVAGRGRGGQGTFSDAAVGDAVKQKT